PPSLAVKWVVQGFIRASGYAARRLRRTHGITAAAPRDPNARTKTPAPSAPSPALAGEGWGGASRGRRCAAPSPQPPPAHGRGRPCSIAFSPRSLDAHAGAGGSEGALFAVGGAAVGEEKVHEVGLAVERDHGVVPDARRIGDGRAARDEEGAQGDEV